jgi:hypothetical protein
MPDLPFSNKFDAQNWASVAYESVELPKARLEGEKVGRHVLPRFAKSNTIKDTASWPPVEWLLRYFVAILLNKM